MKVISSKNTWYLLFGIIFIVIVTSIAFRLIFKRTEEKLIGTKTGITQTQTGTKTSLVGQTSTKSKLSYIKVFPSPVATAQPTPTPSPKLVKISVSETAASPLPTPATSVPTTKGGLQVVTDKNGATYLGTNNADNSTDSAKTLNVPGFSTRIVPPQGFAIDVGLFINQLLRVVLMISVLLVFTQLIWGGLEWITSGGDKKRVEDARNKITAAVIGLIVVAASFAILQLVLNFIGFESINEVMKML